MAQDFIRMAIVLPEYVVEHELGRGGMGVVFLGRHRRLDRPVAIKELPRSFASDPDVRERFSTEARTLASLSHPHIVPIYDYVEREGLCLIVMEQLPGGTLWDRFTNTGVTAATACAIVMASCAALQHAHSRGVLHLDIKPDNLMFDRDGSLKVTDFGISRVISGGQTLGTVDGTVLGTPAYMAPEQALGDDLTAATDVYATAVMLYELISGQLPWHGATSAGELLQQRLEVDPIDLREAAPRIHPGVARVVMRGLSRDPAGRFDTAEDFGVAVGEAAAASWGPGWIDTAGVGVMGSDRLALAARTTTSQARSGDLASGGGPAGTAHATAGAGEGESGVESRVIDIADLEVVRGGPIIRFRGLDLNKLKNDDLVAVDDLLDPPPLPRVAIFATAVLGLSMLIFAAIGLGSPAREAGLTTGQVTIGGRDVAAGSRLTVDLDHDVVVNINDPELARDTTDIALKTKMFGIPLGTETAAVVDGRAVLTPNIMRRISAGDVAGALELESDGKALARHEFVLHGTQSWYLSVVGIGALVMLLIGAANLESSLRPLGRGRRRTLSQLGASVAGATLGVAIVGLAATLGVAEATVVTLVLVTALGAAGGVAACSVTLGVGRRRRLARAMRRAEKSVHAPNPA